jgi:hypothetical protein
MSCGRKTSIKIHVALWGEVDKLIACVDGTADKITKTRQWKSDVYTLSKYGSWRQTIQNVWLQCVYS